MNKLKIISLTLLSFLVCLIIAGCGTKKAEKPAYTAYKGMKIYPVKVTSIGKQDHELVIKGTTKAPEGAKILVKALDAPDFAKDNNMGISNTGDGETFARVENHKVNTQINNLYETVKDDAKLAVANTPIHFKVFAVTGYDEKFEKPLTTSVEIGMEKAKIKTTTYKVDKEFSKYNKDIVGDEQDSKKSTKDSANSNSSSASKASKKYLQSDTMQDYMAASLEKAFHKEIPVKYDRDKKSYVIELDKGKANNSMDIAVNEAKSGDTSDWETFVKFFTEYSDTLNDTGMKSKIVVNDPKSSKKTILTVEKGKVIDDFSKGSNI